MTRFHWNKRRTADVAPYDISIFVYTTEMEMPTDIRLMGQAQNIKCIGFAPHFTNVLATKWWDGIIEWAMQW